MIEVPTVRRRLLGGELRRLRAAAGFSLEDAAQVLECDRSKIGRIETGHRGIRPKELRELLAAYGVDERRRYAMADLARRLSNRGWWQAFGQVLPRPYVDLVSLEIGAASEWTFEAQAVPALLQTEAYARRVVAAACQVTDPRDLDLVVAARMMRQRVWAQWAEPPRLWVVVGEAALRQQVGDRQVMLDQLDHLTAACDIFPSPEAAGTSLRCRRARRFRRLVHRPVLPRPHRPCRCLHRHPDRRPVDRGPRTRRRAPAGVQRPHRRGAVPPGVHHLHRKGGTPAMTHLLHSRRPAPGLPARVSHRRESCTASQGKEANPDG